MSTIEGPSESAIDRLTRNPVITVPATKMRLICVPAKVPRRVHDQLARADIEIEAHQARSIVLA